MSTISLLRSASIASLLFAAGHMLGGLESWSPPGDTDVLRAMQSFRFNAEGSSRTYWDFYVGFGLIIGVFLTAQAVLLWQLAPLSAEQPARLQPIVTIILITTVANALLAWRFFFFIPLVLGIVVASFLALALCRRHAWILRSHAN
jgi:hypothetical protein